MSSLVEKLLSIKRRHAEVQELLATPEVIANQPRSRELGREFRELESIVKASDIYLKLHNDIEGSRAVLNAGGDPELKEMALAEIGELQPKLAAMEEEVKQLLLPKDPNDDRNVIVEIRGGTGGEEAALFASDLYRMYVRFAERKKWKVDTLDWNETDKGGFKEVTISIDGEDVYGTLKFESGGHRVQRVPVTETQGRIHTSAATVIVLPEADEEDDLVIPEADLRIDIFCAGGHGGQGVNTTYSAIRITHLPTGLVAQCQDERSQHRNKDKAMKVLKARILDQRRSAEEAKMGSTRLDLRGSGDRSQRIRTYNFPQNRLTDHRINLTLYSLDRIVEGNLTELLDALHAHDLNQRLETEF